MGRFRAVVVVVVAAAAVVVLVRPDLEEIFYF